MTVSSSPPRYCAIHLPYLSSDRLRRLPKAPFSGLPAEKPLVIVEKVQGALRIAAADPRALKLGLAPGLALAEARARVADLTVADTDATADEALIERLADWCDRYTPLVARAGRQGLILDITGVAHLFRGEAALLADMIGRLRSFGLSVYGAMAGAAETALALARIGRSGIIEPGGEAEAVRPLSVASLGLDRERTVALSRAGLKTIADLIDRPRAPLAARFGADCVDRLERLIGEAEYPISPRRPIAHVTAERIFFEPVTQIDDIGATLRSLAGDVGGLLESRGEGGRGFEASFYRVDGAVRRIAVATARPNRDPKSIARLFRERLDALSDPLDAGFGFDLIRLGVFRAEALAERQADLDGQAGDDEALADLMDRLAARFGPDRVLRLLAENTFDPERRTRLVSALAMDGLETKWDENAGAGEPPLRPLNLFDPPQPIEALAEVPDGPPLRFRWRRIFHEVARAEGPERIAPEWWRRGDDTLDRDYYRVEDKEGRRFWLYREGLYSQDRPNPRWYLHGLFA